MSDAALPALAQPASASAQPAAARRRRRPPGTSPTRTALIVLLDEWNRTRAMPKAFTILPDDGLVGICAENAFDFAAKATREQIKFTLGFWIETLLHFAEWTEEQLDAAS